MAHGTDGELITYDATGAPANVAVGTSGQVLTSGGAGVAPTFQTSTHTPDDNSVTLAKMAGGTDGNLITYDASGDPAYVTTGTSGQVLTSGGVGVAPTFQTAAGGGKVLQVKIVEDSSAQTLSTTTYTDTNLSLSITPAAGSKVLCQWNVIHHIDSDEGVACRLVRDSTPVFTTTGNLWAYNGTQGNDHNGVSSFTHLDASPGGDGSTAITYKIQVSSYLSKSIILNRDGNQTQLLLTEIGA
jgi:hypothetical protein